MKDSNPIYVTRPNLPDLGRYTELLSQIWASGVLTNSGPLHNRLEAELARYLDVPYVSLFNNGTVALTVALQSLELPLGSEIITTPFTFVATAHSIVWNNCTPVFVDIDSKTCNIDVEKIERAVTEKTRAILGVHCYGNPCDVDALSELAKKYNLYMVYDAAHAFGVKKDNNSIFKYGDLSALSFHATKVFSTVEGGAIVSHTEAMKRKIDLLRNFGIQDETTVVSLGINGKMSELNAAYGLLQLENIDEIIRKRRKIDSVYRERLQALNGLTMLQFADDVLSNGSYFPVFVKPYASVSRDEIYSRLKDHNIYARKYFYPLITLMEPYKTNITSIQSQALNIANALTSQVICLPIYPDLSIENVHMICDYLCEWLTNE